MEFMAGMVQFWHNLHDKVQPYLPGACSQENQEAHFSRHGHGEADTELRNFDGPAEVGPDGEEVSEFNEFGERIIPTRNYVGESHFEEIDPTDQISEWQAGWNVTNAIQVLLQLYCTN